MGGMAGMEVVLVMVISGRKFKFLDLMMRILSQSLLKGHSTHWPTFVSSYLLERNQGSVLYLGQALYVV